MMSKHSRQAGGTLLGLIIGLIIGLGIAVVVAFMITKTPVPFMNKVGRADKPGELTPGQSADPNTPMFGKQNAAREAAKGFIKETSVAATAPADAALPSTDKPKLLESAGTKPVDGKDAIRNTTVKPDPAQDKWIYYLQAGAFREHTDAESARAKLALQGFEAGISEKTSDNGSLYRVRLGPYDQLEAMNRVRGKLSDSGMDVAVVRMAK
ncbi:MAG TPA: SPOR domain-containing protein [Paucimonas sp.]|nr:SPOR domain-containing protein [Paucimonas sp.]HJW56262.1 SPOR domain-containing protein [Burkholderiaceae bacterium]